MQATATMYAVYRQLHPPTGIEHSIYCNFLSSSEKNLIITGVNQLSVYRLNNDAEVRKMIVTLLRLHSPMKALTNLNFKKIS